MRLATWWVCWRSRTKRSFRCASAIHSPEVPEMDVLAYTKKPSDAISPCPLYPRTRDDLETTFRKEPSGFRASLSIRTMISKLARYATKLPQRYLESAPPEHASDSCLKSTFYQELSSVHTPSYIACLTDDLLPDVSLLLAMGLWIHACASCPRRQWLSYDQQTGSQQARDHGLLYVSIVSLMPC